MERDGDGKPDREKPDREKPDREKPDRAKPDPDPEISKADIVGRQTEIKSEASNQKTQPHP